jgi:hypothetical protein
MEISTSRFPSALTTTASRKENIMAHSAQREAAVAPKAGRPGGVTFAAVLQLLIALAFLSIPFIGFVHGADIQAAAEAEMVRQGFSASVLAEHGLAFDESGFATLMPVAVAVIMAGLALLNLTGRRIGRTLSWVFQPLVLLGNVAIVLSNMSAVQAVESLFQSSGDASLRNIDVQALLDAANSAYPGWVTSLVDARSIVVTLGSVLVMVLLALPSARAYFRKVRPASK